MATRISRSPSISPERYEQPYDPFFDPPLDPIEMSNMSSGRRRVSTGRESLEQPRGRSPGASRVSFSDAPFGAHISPSDSPTKQYAPVPSGQSSSRAPTCNSGGASMYSDGSRLKPYKTMDAATQALLDKRSGELAQWHVHWVTPASIAALFIAGVLAAFGHHIFYDHLSGRPAENQLRMIRYGTALAFFVKSTLVGTVILCFRQRIWHTFRRKAMTINAIDGLFSVTEDPTQFSNWEMIRNGKLATFMALCSWLIPLASVLSPSALTSELRTSYQATQCEAVASLNFTHESLYNFRHEDEFPGSSVAYYNTTDVNGTTDGYFDYYDQPSKNAKRLAITAAYLGKPATNTLASHNSCGEGWNCTYSINFEGPGYNCEEMANSSLPDLAAGAAPFNLSKLAPQGNTLYLGDVDLGDYMRPQVDTTDQGEPEEGPPYPELLGVFQTEPILWIGYAVNTTTPYPEDSPFKERWRNVHEPHIFKCIAHHTKYEYHMNYTDNIQTATRSKREWVAPIVNTDVSLTDIDSPPSPSSGFVKPQDPELYKITAAYHAMGALLRNFLRGEIFYNKPYFVTKSDISETRLMQPSTSYPVPDLMDQLQNVFEEMILTLLSEPHLVVADKQSVSCTKSRTVNVYVYHKEGLWIGYAIAVAAALLFIGVGAYSIVQNGVASDTQFSRIMVTTRNPTLDRLSVGACLGGDPFPKELTRTKLRFGVLLEHDEGEEGMEGRVVYREGPLGKVEHCCFGAAGETKDIVKYGVYAGLRKWLPGSAETEEVGTLDEKRGLLEDSEEAFLDTVEEIAVPF